MFCFGVYDVLKNYEDNACEMTYMYEMPEYMVRNRSRLEYCAAVWDPYLIKDINTLERSLQKVQGHRAGFDVDVTPRTGGPVGHMLSIRWPCVTHSAQ